MFIAEIGRIFTPGYSSSKTQEKVFIDINTVQYFLLKLIRIEILISEVLIELLIFL